MKLTAETTIKGIAVATGAITALMAAGELHHALEEETVYQPAVAVEDPLRLALQRCRTLTPEELKADTECQSVWAENRRRFFSIPSDGQETE